MRFCFLLLIAAMLWSCEARRRQQARRREGGIRNFKSGKDSFSGVENRPGAERHFAATLRASPGEERQGIPNRRNPLRKNRNRGIRRQRQNPQQPSFRSKSNRREERRKERLRSTMRHMFGFEHMDSPRVSTDVSIDAEELEHRRTRQDISRRLFSSLRQDSVSSSHRSLPNPPDFMLELYRTYSEDRSLMHINSRSQGDTVRSFFSVAGESPDRLRDKGKPMIIIPYFKRQNTMQTSADRAARRTGSRRNQMRVFAFNVTSIPSTETVVAAELRLDGLRNTALRNRNGNAQSPNSTHSAWTAALAVYQVAESNDNETRNIYQRVGELVTIRPNSSFSWVDNRIALLTSTARQSNCVLIVKFNDGNTARVLRRKRSAFRSIPNDSDLSSITSSDPSPNLPSYFVVLSDRSKRNSGDRRTSSSARSTQLTPILIVYCNDTTVDDASPAASPQNSMQILSAIQNLNGTAKKRRSRRSPRRRLRDDSTLPSSDQGNNEFPGESGRSGASSRSTTDFPSTPDNDQTELHDNGRSELRVIQSLKDRRSLSRRRKNKKRKRGRKCRKRKGRKGKKSRKCRKEAPAAAPMERSLNRVQKTCSRKSLNVDFEDMGWADWIISPKSFDSYYCSGMCEFDTMKSASPSNHAIIQAFIKAFEINAEVPAPCCVPDRLMSLSVLFFDKDGNVVLKVFPKMSVESCACR